MTTALLCLVGYLLVIWLTLALCKAAAAGDRAREAAFELFLLEKQEAEGLQNRRYEP